MYVSRIIFWYVALTFCQYALSDSTCEWENIDKCRENFSERWILVGHTYYLVKVIGHKSWPILWLQWSGGMKKSRLGSITYLTFPVFRYRVSKERDAYQKHLKPGIHTLSRRVLSTGMETQKTSSKLQSGNWVAKIKVLSRAYSV